MVKDRGATVFAVDVPLVEAVQQGMTSRASESGPSRVDKDQTEVSEHAAAVIQRLRRKTMDVSL